jgi:beta-mannosidase
VTAEVVGETFSEWRRIGSRCSGALVWQFQDVVPGAGWGVVDACLRPKASWYAMKHSLQPQQIVLTDEGLNGLDLHLLNDSARALRATVEIVALRDGTVPLVRARRDVQLDTHRGLVLNAAQLLGQFFDFTYAYRFGPREHDTVVASLYNADGTLLSQAFYFPERTQANIFERADIGLDARAESVEGDCWVTIQTRRLARYVQLSAPGWLPLDDWFHLAPGDSRRVKLHRDDASGHPFAPSRPSASHANGASPVIEVRALNSSRTIRIRCT